MYGLPADFDGSLFLTKRLEQICFTENQLSLSFADGLAVTVEGAFRYEAVDPRESSGTVQPPIYTSSLMRLLGHHVANVKAETDGTLTFGFDGGETLSCYDDSKNTESYHIKYDDRVIHV